MRKMILCPICLTKGSFIECKPVKNDYFECPECQVGIWPPDHDEKLVVKWREQTKEQSCNTYRSCSLPEGVHVHGGEKKQGKNSLDAKMGKNPVSKLNVLLYKDR